MSNRIDLNDRVIKETVDRIMKLDAGSVTQTAAIRIALLEKLERLERKAAATKFRREFSKNERDYAAGRITFDEYNKRVKSMKTVSES